MTRVVPDPELSLSEAVNTMGTLKHVIDAKGGDAVLEAAWEKLRVAANQHARNHPDQMTAVTQEIKMRARLGSQGSDIG